VQGTGMDGEELVIVTEGFEARAFQHEIDHLDGLLILDRVASIERDVFQRKVYR
jgi:peptide deformylase